MRQTHRQYGTPNDTGQPADSPTRGDAGPSAGRRTSREDPHRQDQIVNQISLNRREPLQPAEVLDEYRGKY
jgi:hypothetical protein